MDAKQNGYTIFKGYDPIHGNIRISQAAQYITKHWVFDRLRHISQLGAVHFAIRYATHTRYEHSIGVAHLARYVGEHLQTIHSEITDKMILCLEISGLCHDLGHGAYSHTFDTMLKAINDKHPNTHHESRSMILVRFMLEDMISKKTLGVVLDDADIRLIQYFIDPIRYKNQFCSYKLTQTQMDDITYHPPDISKFMPGMEQIVNNPIHNVDIDKFDYLLRDAESFRFNITMPNDIKLTKILSATQIVEKTWAFCVGDYTKVYGLICRRFIFYQNYYVSPDCSVANRMFMDAVLSASSLFKLDGCLNLRDEKEIKSFCKVTDSYLRQTILNSADTSKKVANAKNLLMRLIKRENWYEYIGTYVSDTSINTDTYRDLPLDVCKDKSSPMKSIPKLVCHANGKFANPALTHDVLRIYRNPLG